MGNESVVASAVDSTCDELDLRDKMDRLLAQLKALVYCTYGPSGEEFRRMSDELADDYMWAIDGMVDDAKATWKLLEKSRSQVM